MIGPHVMGGIGEYRELIRRWRPQALLLVDPSGGAAAEIKSWSPGTFLVGRVFQPDSEIEKRILADPISAAQWAAGLIKPAAAGNPDVDVWQFNNEVAQADPGQIAKLAEFTKEYIKLLAASGLAAAIGCFSVGRPEAPPNDSGAAWNAFAPAMKAGMAQNAVLLLHAYGRPRIFGDPQTHDSPPEWYLQRYEYVVRPFLPAEVRDITYIYGEYGCDMRTGREGWKTGYKGDYAAYIKDLHKAAEFLAQQPNCLGACVFTLGTSSQDWVDFDVRGDPAEALSRRPWPTQPKPGAAMHPRGLRSARRRTVLPSPAATVSAAPEAERLFKDRRTRPMADLALKTSLLERIVADGCVPTSKEFSVRVGGEACQAQTASHPKTGEERVYYALKGHPDKVRQVLN